MDASEIALLDTIATPLFVIEPDVNGIPIYGAFNKTARQAAGKCLADILGKTAKEIYQGRMGAIAYERHVQSIASKRPITYELNLPLRGIKRRIRTTLMPTVDQSGTVRRLTGTSQDISAETTLREIEISSENLDSEMLQFVNLAAHDLRSPMRNVQGLATLLRDGFVDHGDGKIELIDMLEHIAVKATDLISDVLLHAHTIDSPNAFCRFDLGELCSDILITLDPAGKYDTVFSQGWVDGDHVVTQITLRNLIDNALKQGGNQPVRLQISAQNAQHGFFEIAVRDNGSGFADPVLAFLETGEIRNDSGFGLVGIRRLIESRGGAISAENPSTGSGAIVCFQLPGHFVSAMQPSTL